MMQRGFQVMFLACLVSTAQAYEGFGICNFGSETVPAVICYGPAGLKGTTVKGDLKVAGPLTAENISAGSLTITGSVDMKNSKIAGAVTVTGDFNATNVELGQGPNLTSDTVFLHHTKIKGTVTVNNTSTNPNMTMECGTLITGDVKFVGKAGVIQITDDSIIQGKVNNGSMIFIKKKC